MRVANTSTVARRHSATAPSRDAADPWFQDCLALTCDWLWTVDADLATVEFVASRSVGGACRTSRHALWDGIAETCHTANGRVRLEAEMRARRPFRDYVFSLERDGDSHRFIKLSGLPQFDDAGSFLGYRGVGVDVTEHYAEIEQQRALAEHQRARLGWFRTAIDRIGQGVGVFDKEGRLLVCNRFYRETFRSGDRVLPPDVELEGKTYRELMELRVRYKLHKEFADQPEKFVEDRMRRFEEGGDHIVNMANGTVIRAQYRTMADGVRFYVGTDITEMVAGENTRRELEAQLHHSQKLESLGTLAGGIAHDVNNTLVPILALTKIVARHLEPGSADRGHLETVLEAGKRARDLVQQILAFSRKEVMTRQRFDLAEVVRKEMTMLRAMIPSTIKIALTVAKVPEILGDPGQWQQVLMNLVSNAAKAMALEPGVLTVELTPTESGLRLTIADTGCGMDEETSRRVFEPFFTTRKVGEGTGLGLSLVHGIITSHGGKIGFESAPGHGTKFVIEQPAAETALLADEAAAQA